MADIFQSFREGYDWSNKAVQDYQDKQEWNKLQQQISADSQPTQAPGEAPPAPVTDTAAKAPEMPRGMGGLTAEQGKGVAPKPTATSPTGFSSRAAALTPPQPTAAKYDQIIKMGMASGISPKNLDRLMALKDRAVLDDARNKSEFLTQKGEAMENLIQYIDVASTKEDMLHAFSGSAFSHDPKFMQVVQSTLANPNVTVDQARSMFQRMAVPAKDALKNELDTVRAQNKWLTDQAKEKATAQHQHNVEQLQARGLQIAAARLNVEADRAATSRYAAVSSNLRDNYNIKSRQLDEEYKAGKIDEAEYEKRANRLDSDFETVLDKAANTILGGKKEAPKEDKSKGKPMPSGDKLTEYAKAHFGGDTAKAKAFLETQGYK